MLHHLRGDPQGMLDGFELKGFVEKQKTPKRNEEGKEKIKIGRFPDDDLKIQGFCIGSMTMMFIVGPTPAHRFEIVHETRNLIKKMVPEFRFEGCFVTGLMPQGITAGIDVSVDDEKDETPPGPPCHPCQITKKKNMIN